MYIIYDLQAIRYSDDEHIHNNWQWSGSMHICLDKDTQL